jgi:hypothetical protein
MSFLQTIFVDRIDNLSEHCAEPSGNESQFFVKGVFQDILVYVTHQVDQALLLLTRHGVVPTVEIAY